MAGRSASEAREYSQSIISMYTMEEEWCEEGGQFLPLSAWAAKGFDIKQIEEKA